MIDPSLLPCYISTNADAANIYLVSYIDYRDPNDIKYYHDGHWVCAEADNPQLLITLAEMQMYFPERLI